MHTRTAANLIPCPHADKHNCHKRFTTVINAMRHSKNYIPADTLFPCPYAETHNCPRTFPRRGSAKLHGIKAHREMSTPIGPTKLPDSSTIYGTKPDFQSSAHLVDPDFCQSEHFQESISEDKSTKVAMAPTISTVDTNRIRCPYAEAYSYS
jgi:hypothetical protein